MSDTEDITRRPKQERSQATYELLLNVAGELLAAVGVDRISTNLICARAGLTPPGALSLFRRQTCVLEALGRRLMARQNAALEGWIARHEGGGVAALRGNIEELLRETAAGGREAQLRPDRQNRAVWIGVQHHQRAAGILSGRRNPDIFANSIPTP